MFIELGHRFDRHADLEVERFADTGVDDRAAPAGADQEASDFLERALRGREPNPLYVAAGGSRQPLERERQMGPAFGGGDRVNLVDDAPACTRKQRLSATGEHEVQRLGRGDEDVGWVAQHRLTLALRRVAGAHCDFQVPSL
jgi:hypothetical protein